MSKVEKKFKSGDVRKCWEVTKLFTKVFFSSKCFFGHIEFILDNSGKVSFGKRPKKLPKLSARDSKAEMFLKKLNFKKLFLWILLEALSTTTPKNWPTPKFFNHLQKILLIFPGKDTLERSARHIECGFGNSADIIPDERPQFFSLITEKFEKMDFFS